MRNGKLEMVRVWQDERKFHFCGFAKFRFSRVFQICGPEIFEPEIFGPKIFDQNFWSEFLVKFWGQKWGQKSDQILGQKMESNFGPKNGVKFLV